MTTISFTANTDLAKTIKARADERSGGIKSLAEGRSDLHKVNPYLIEVEDGFNVRDFESPEVAEHVDALAQSIADIGIQRPLKVRNKNNKLILKDGECRLRATFRAIEVYGAEILTIPIILTDRSESDADAVLGILVENSGLEVSPLGKAEIVKRLTAFGWSNAEIAKRSGMSLNRVFQLRDISGLSSEVKSLISDGTISATAAHALARENGFDDVKTADQIKEAAVEVAKTGRKRVTATALGKNKKKAVDTGLEDAAKLFNMALVDIDDKLDTVAVVFNKEDYDAICKLLQLA